MLEETSSQKENISYYEEDSKDTALENQNNIKIIVENNLNKLTRKNNSNQVITLQNKKRGRKSKNKKEIKRIHNKYKRDNIVNKIKVRYHKFIIKKLNQKLNELKINESFDNFAGFFQSDISISSNRKLMNIKISDILIKIECSRNKNFYNKFVYERVCKIKEMEILFSKTYKEFYEEYFRNSKEQNSFIKKEGKYVIPVLNSFFNNFMNKPKNPKKKSKLNELLFIDDNKTNSLL